MTMTYALFIDDDTEILDSLRAAVEGAGLELLTAETWEDGLSMFSAYAPDLVISDFNLVGSKTGLRLLLDLAVLKPSVRLILISAFLNDEDADQVREMGLVHDVLNKSDPVETARRVIAEVADARQNSLTPTDWLAVGKATTRVSRVDDDTFSKLEQYLVDNRLSGEGGK